MTARTVEFVGLTAALASRFPEAIHQLPVYLSSGESTFLESRCSAEGGSWLVIDQQTMPHYEGGVSRSAVATLSELPSALDTTVEDLIGTSAPRGSGKRGPAPKIQQQPERVGVLPKAKQRAIAQVLDSMLAQSSG